MNFPSHRETSNIFNNLFAFFGNLDLQGCIINLQGRILQSAFTNTQNLSGKKFSEVFLRQNSVTNTNKLEKAIIEAAENETSLYLDFTISDRDNSFVQMFLYPVLDEASKTEHIFFCALEVAEENKKNHITNFSQTDEEINRKARLEIEKANRDKDFFLAFLSHEMRSPLNTILGWTKILLTKEVGEASRKNALETIEKNARLQAKLIDDLVDSAKISSGKLRLELTETNLSDVLKSVCDSQKSLAEVKNVTLEYTSDKKNILIFADSARLRQLITILVSNALKNTISGGYIKINLKANDTEAAITIGDSGQGIDPESLPDIFDQFRRSDEKKSFNSNALGLSIVKILAEKHNGRVRAESEGIGFGSTFTVELPLVDSELKSDGIIAKKNITNNYRRLNEINILVVEDDADSREVLQLFLEQSGARVKSAESAFDAMSLIRESTTNLPDMIISDLGMPNEDGYSLLSRIRKLPTEKGGSIPAIALSAFTSYNNKQQAFQAGFQKYHTKPFEPDGLIQDILTLVKK